MNTSIPHLGRRTFGVMIAALPAAALAQGADPLPSWRDGPRKRALLDFVASVTREGGAGYVPPLSSSWIAFAPWRRKIPLGSRMRFFAQPLRAICMPPWRVAMKG